MKIPVGTLLATIFFADDGVAFPAYSQQCADDAGPPFMDDSETFGSNPYHFGSAAEPVLKTNGQCADPIQGACGARGDVKTAYLEGPIDCGNNGWYCRILPDENWPPIALTSDVNFGYCNQTGGFEDAGFDRDGHCHGSNRDSTYYWWIRDHWFRQYNGRLRCCCNWESGSDPLTAGRIANRCDFRKELQPGEADSCRDANEEHNQSFNGGCDPSFGAEQLGKPLVENDAQCWEVTRFGFTEGNEVNNNISENDDERDEFDEGEEEDEDEDEGEFEEGSEDEDEEGSEDEDEEGSEDEDEEGSEDEDEEGSEDEDEEGSEDEDEEGSEEAEGSEEDDEVRNVCEWVEKKPSRRCFKRWMGEQLSAYCPETCESFRPLNSEDRRRLRMRSS